MEPREGRGERGSLCFVIYLDAELSRTRNREDGEGLGMHGLWDVLRGCAGEQRGALGLRVWRARE